MHINGSFQCGGGGCEKRFVTMTKVLLLLLSRDKMGK